MTINKPQIKSLYLSDIHIGVAENHVKQATEILDKYEFDKLYLVGDIIDIKELSRKWNWNHNSTEFLHKVLKISGKKKVYYIQGNHERNFFDNVPKGIIPITICRYVIENDKLIIHGDQFDTLIGYNRWLKWLGGNGYNFTIWLNHKINLIRSLLGLKKELKLGKAIKQLVKRNSNYFETFKIAAAEYSKYKNCSTVICGHVHQPEDTYVNGIRYINCGDMRQDMTYVIEHINGNLELLHYYE